MRPISDLSPRLCKWLFTAIAELPMEDPFTGYSVSNGWLASPRPALFLHKVYLLAKRLNFWAAVCFTSEFVAANDMS